MHHIFTPVVISNLCTDTLVIFLKKEYTTIIKKQALKKDKTKELIGIIALLSVLTAKA